MRGRPVEVTKIYIAGDHLDFAWHERELKSVKELWEQGYHLATMAKKLQRDPMEVMILLEGFLRNGTMEERRGGYRGRL